MSYNQMFDSRFAGSNGGAREIHSEIGNQEELLPVLGNQNRHGYSMETGRRLLRLGCAPLVAVMKPANLRDRNDGAAVRRVHWSRFRRVFGQREVCPGFVIIRQE
jgi:hypothetical protein